MNTRHPDGTPIQSAVLQQDSRYQHTAVTQLMVGVVLEVYPSDSYQNRSAWQRTDRRGQWHECTVLVLNDATGAYMRLKNVVILPVGPSGIDNYTEYLPRPSTKLVTAQEYNNSLHVVDPYELDGDFCVVGFIGGSIDQPVLLSYYPHPRNTLDPATSGGGNPDSNGAGTALVQNRYFQRMNGVEYVVTKMGDIYLSTTYAGGVVDFEAPLEKGRFARQVPDVGGSVCVDIKPGQFLELNFNPTVDGAGLFGAWEDALPQTNPRNMRQPPTRGTDKTYVHFDETGTVLSSAETSFNCDTLTVEAETSISMETQTTTIESSSVCDIIGNNVNLGDANLPPTNTLLLSSFATDPTLISTLASAASAAATASSTPTPPNIAAATTALNAALIALVSALSGNITSKVKAS